MNLQLVVIVTLKVLTCDIFSPCSVGSSCLYVLLLKDLEKDLKRSF